MLKAVRQKFFIHIDIFLNLTNLLLTLVSVFWKKHQNAQKI